MSGDESTFTSTVTEMAGDVWMSLPEGVYVKYTPDQARKMAIALFRKANEAEGIPAPQVIFCPSN